MNRKLYTSLVLLMSFSLIGIILMQGYWIYSSWKNKEEEFSLAVNRTLREVVDEIQSRELNDYVNTYQMLIDSIGSPDEQNFTDVFLFLDEDQSSNLSTFFAYGILEEDYNINLPDNLSNRYGDDNLKDYKAVKTTIVNKNIFDRRENRLNASISKLKSVEDIDMFKFEKYKSAFQEYASSLPIHKRTTSREIQILLDQGFNNQNIVTPYEFGIYSNGLSTKVKSNNYIEVQSGPKYSIPFMYDRSSPIKYDLVVSFPEKQEYVLSGIIGVATLSFMLTLIIIVISTSALYQIIQQKKLSEIKSDFINNISHEFKTPIATIDLALNAIKNEKIKKDEKLKIKYLNIINEENKRMNTQVENILMISKLDKNQIIEDKKLFDIHDIIMEASKRISLLLQTKEGNITFKFKANHAKMMVSHENFTNLFVNIFENSIKYSNNKPTITVNTLNRNSKLEITISDEGIGIPNKLKSKIFEKFFRISEGNLHNVKGHGLGLSFVKGIVDLHRGEIFVKSQVGKGTVFKIIFNLK